MPGENLFPVKRCTRAKYRYNQRMSISFLWILLALAAYGLLHSLLASHAAKRAAYRLAGKSACRFYRLAYNGLVTLTLLPVLALAAWLPDETIYTIPFPWRVLTLLLQAAAGAALLAGVLQTGALSFLGIRQALDAEAAAAGCPPGRPVHPSLRTAGLVTEGLYRWVRHPLYTAGLLFLWLTPVLTWNGLAFNLGVTAYILIGAYFEERKLLLEWGQAYADYRERTPMLLPRLRQKKEAK